MNKQVKYNKVLSAINSLKGKNLDKLMEASKKFNSDALQSGNKQIDIKAYKELLIDNILTSKQINVTVAIGKKEKWNKGQLTKDIMSVITPEVKDYSVKLFSIKLLKNKQVETVGGKKTTHYSKLYNRINSYLTRVYKEQGVGGPYISELIKQSGEFVSVPEKGSNVYKLEVMLPQKTSGKIIYTKLIIYVEFEGGQIIDQYIELYDTNGNVYDIDSEGYDKNGNKLL